MKRTITVILAIVLMAVPANSIAHIEKRAEYDKRYEKQIAEMQAQLPMGKEDFRLAAVEKRGQVIITTLETKGKYGWIAMAEEIGGVEKFKAMMQRQQAEDALLVSGLQLARRYTLRFRFVDNGKEVCTVDVSAMIIGSMIMNFVSVASFL